MRLRKNVCLAIAFFAALFLSAATSGFALTIDDGFGQSNAEGNYFSIYCSSGVDSADLIQSLNIASSDKILVGKSAQQSASSAAELADTLDTLYLRVSDILDMHIYNFKGKIKICADHNQVNRVYNNLFGQDLAGYAHAFYVHELSTIYISAEHFTRLVLGHEIAHALICNYFVVPPSMKVQEVLAGYIEYQLRKTGQ